MSPNGLLLERHWLPIHYRINVKLLTLTFNTLSFQQPPHLSSLLYIFIAFLDPLTLYVPQATISLPFTDIFLKNAVENSISSPIPQSSSHITTTDIAGIVGRH